LVWRLPLSFQARSAAMLALARPGRPDLLVAAVGGVAGTALYTLPQYAVTAPPPAAAAATTPLAPAGRAEAEVRVASMLDDYHIVCLAASPDRRFVAMVRRGGSACA
jgi:hypothetical protein